MEHTKQSGASGYEGITGRIVRTNKKKVYRRKCNGEFLLQSRDWTVTKTLKEIVAGNWF